MILEKIISEGIAAQSYFIASETKAVVIDPRRDVEEYLELARKHNVKIAAIFDTHRNEDFVNGSVQLAHQTGAVIYHGEGLPFHYGQPVKDGEHFTFDDLIFEVLTTPGHTPESISILVKTKKHSEQPFLVFTGDTLFAGDVGRIDFYRDKEKQQKAAHWLYNSLFEKLLQLDDGTIVLPAHGSGSICGGSISSLPYTTIGYEKRTNPYLSLTKEEFLSYKATETFEIAPNMTTIEKLNLEGAPLLDGLPNPKPMTVAEVKQAQKDGAQIVDIREPESFAGGHIPNSLSIWKNGLPTYALWMLEYAKPIVIIKSTHQDLTLALRYLVRLGFDNVIGYLRGFRNWYLEGEQYQKTDVWSVHDLNEHLEDTDLFILDVRTAHSVKENGRIKGSNHIFLGNLPLEMQKVPREKRIAVYCDSGFKTFTAVSFLLKNGYKNVVGIFGSMKAWINAGCPFEE
ncbi:MAG: MBL fold metallo-hydrolase [Candidatus Heimdallarchaeota archaeon]|nr:MBL fold metallo-hydrolase [Candidatus Heimdallarchaeota archaeon]